MLASSRHETRTGKAGAGASLAPGPPRFATASHRSISGVILVAIKSTIGCRSFASNDRPDWEDLLKIEKRLSFSLVLWGHFFLESCFVALSATRNQDKKKSLCEVS